MDYEPIRSLSDWLLADCNATQSVSERSHATPDKTSIQRASPMALSKRLIPMGALLFRCTQALLVVGCLSIALGSVLVYQQGETAVRSTSAFRSPRNLSSSEQRLKCYQERDHGLIQALRASAKEFCANSQSASDTKVTILQAPGGVRATVFSSLVLDLYRVNVNRPISSIARDGGGHDPRFTFRPNLIYCHCAELEQYARTQRRVTVDDTNQNTATEEAEPLLLWSPTLTHLPAQNEHPSTLCSPRSPGGPLATPKAVLKKSHVRESGYEKPNRLVRAQPFDVVVPDQVLLIARKDDHNPFFQISNALNAWLLMKALDWNPAETQVVHLDGGFPSPVDALHERLLSPGRPVIRGTELRGKLIQFQSHVALTPFEDEGPMMQDLNNDNPCFNSTLIQDFRVASLLAFNFSSEQISPSAGDIVINEDKPIIVTIITRRPYNGRKVQRVWRNEDEVIEGLRSVYSNQNVQFRSIDFANLDLHEQMQLMVESDVVIGMHGAGMVNVLWTRRETLVLEIFPKEKKRWGYRNLCQSIGCTYRDFRGGEDISTLREGVKGDANMNDKNVSFEEFFAFFDPLFKTYVQRSGT